LRSKNRKPISLKTTKKGLAQHRLEEYIKGKYGLKPTPTVKEIFRQVDRKKDRAAVSSGAGQRLSAAFQRLHSEVQKHAVAGDRDRGLNRLEELNYFAAG
jgi:pyruvate/oxaloacetate carboxyltransferase